MGLVDVLQQAIRVQSSESLRLGTGKGKGNDPDGNDRDCPRDHNGKGGREGPWGITVKDHITGKTKCSERTRSSGRHRGITTNNEEDENEERRW